MNKGTCDRKLCAPRVFWHVRSGTYLALEVHRDVMAPLGRGTDEVLGTRLATQRVGGGHVGFKRHYRRERGTPANAAHWVSQLLVLSESLGALPLSTTPLHKATTATSATASATTSTTT